MSHGDKLEWTSEAQAAADRLCRTPGGHQVLDHDDLRSLLYNTGGQLLAQGSLWNIKVNQLGAGISRVSLELANP